MCARTKDHRSPRLHLDLKESSTAVRFVNSSQNFYLLMSMIMCVSLQWNITCRHNSSDSTLSRHVAALRKVLSSHTAEAASKSDSLMKIEEADSSSSASFESTLFEEMITPAAGGCGVVWSLQRSAWPHLTRLLMTPAEPSIFSRFFSRQLIPVRDSFWEPALRAAGIQFGK